MEMARTLSLLLQHYELFARSHPRTMLSLVHCNPLSIVCVQGSWESVACVAGTLSVWASPMKLWHRSIRCVPLVSEAERVSERGRAQMKCHSVLSTEH